MTTVYGIVGDPIAQARSPHVFNTLFSERSIDAVMVPMHVVPDAFSAVLAGLRRMENFGGLVVTVPHKFAAAQELTERSRRVEIAGAANALKPTATGWSGDLFDGEGFAKGVEAHGFGIEGKACAIVGCGGAGTAIALALVDRTVASLRLWDLDPRRAHLLKERLERSAAVRVTVAPPGDAEDLAVNASPVGMSDNDDLPFDPRWLRRDALVCEAIMKPPRTRLLAEAERLGLPVHEGRHMLDHQVELIWRFFGLPDPGLRDAT